MPSKIAGSDFSGAIERIDLPATFIGQYAKVVTGVKQIRIQAGERRVGLPGAARPGEEESTIRISDGATMNGKLANAEQPVVQQGSQRRADFPMRHLPRIGRPIDRALFG